MYEKGSLFTASTSPPYLNYCDFSKFMHYLEIGHLFQFFMVIKYQPHPCLRTPYYQELESRGVQYIVHSPSGVSAEKNNSYRSHKVWICQTWLQDSVNQGTLYRIKRVGNKYPPNTFCTLVSAGLRKALFLLFAICNKYFQI